MFSLHRAYDEVILDFQRRLQEEGVHYIQALILTGIFFEERPVRPSELAKTLGSSRPNISHALRGLEKKGWITRGSSPLDARAYFFELTKEGRKKVPKLIKIFDRIEDRFDAWPEAKRLTHFLEALIKAYRESQSEMRDR